MQIHGVIPPVATAMKTDESLDLPRFRWFLDHLIANSLPLAILGTVMLHLYPRSSRSVLPSVYLLPGIAVWLFARDGVHVGASGLVYGLVSYIFLAGIIRRDKRNAGFRRHPTDLRQDEFVLLETVILHFEEKVAFAE